MQYDKIFHLELLITTTYDTPLLIWWYRKVSPPKLELCDKILLSLNLRTPFDKNLLVLCRSLKEELLQLHYFFFFYFSILLGFVSAKWVNVYIMIHKEGSHDTIKKQIRLDANHFSTSQP